MAAFGDHVVKCVVLTCLDDNGAVNRADLVNRAVSACIHVKFAVICYCYVFGRKVSACRKFRGTALYCQRCLVLRRNSRNNLVSDDNITACGCLPDSFCRCAGRDKYCTLPGETVIRTDSHSADFDTAASGCFASRVKMRAAYKYSRFACLFIDDPRAASLNRQFFDSDCARADRIRVVRVDIEIFSVLILLHGQQLIRSDLCVSAIDNRQYILWFFVSCRIRKDDAAVFRGNIPDHAVDDDVFIERHVAAVYVQVCFCRDNISVTDYTFLLQQLGFLNRRDNLELIVVCADRTVTAGVDCDSAACFDIRIIRCDARRLVAVQDGSVRISDADRQAAFFGADQLRHEVCA